MLAIKEVTLNSTTYKCEPKFLGEGSFGTEFGTKGN